MSIEIPTAAEWLWTQTWQLACIGLLVLPLASLIARKRPHVGLLLCYLVLAKALLPPSIGHANTLFHWITAPQELAAVDTKKNEKDSSTKATSLIEETEMSPLENVAESLPKPQPNGLPANAFVTVPPPVSKIPPPTRTWRDYQSEFQALFVGMWALGSTLSLILWTRQHQQLRHLIGRATRVDRHPANGVLANLKARLGIRRPVHLYVIQEATSPAAIGWRRPKIILSRQLIETADLAHLEAILAHELLHIRRGDTTVGFVQCVTQILWWFHPTIWIVNRQINQLREVCCDGEVLHLAAISNTTYAQALLDVVKQTPTSQVPNYVPSVRSQQLTTHRIENVMNAPQSLSHRTSILGWICAVAIAAFVLPNAKTETNRLETTPSSPQSGFEKKPTPLLLAAGPSSLESAPPKGNLLDLPADKIFRVQRETVHVHVGQSSGILKPRTQLFIKSAVEGTIAETRIVPGRQVERGDLLVRIANPELESAFKSANLELEKAYATLKRSDIVEAENQLKAKAELQQAELELAQAEQSFKSSRKLSEKNLISTKQLEVESETLEKARANVEYLQQASELVARKSEQDRQLQELELERLKIARQTIAERLSGLQILSPIDGVIAEAKHQALIPKGAVVSPGTVLARVFQPDVLDIETSFRSNLISKLSLGMRCDVRINSHPFAGKVRLISPTVGPQAGHVGVVVEIDPDSGPSEALIPGSVGTIHYIEKTIPDALTLPAIFPDEDENQRSVYKLNPSGESAKTTLITIGDKSGHRRVITSGLAVGDEVFIRSHQKDPRKRRTVRLLD